jgi:hypothetical protein
LVHAPQGEAAGHPTNQRRTPIRDWIVDTRGKANDGDTRNVLNQGRHDAVTTPGYHRNMVAAMTAGRIGPRRRSPREPVCSAGRSAR